MSKSGNGVKERAKLTEKQAEEKRKNAAAKAGLQNGQSFDQSKKEYLDKLLRSGMSDAGINLLDNMLDESFVLGNIDAAEYHDLRWQLRAIYVKIRSNFPPAESEITGDERAFILDDRTEAVTPLTGQQRTIIAEMLRGLALRASRSKDGFQQEMLVKSINVSEIVEDGQDQQEGMLGLFE